MEQRLLQITLPDGRKFQMPDCRANRGYYERLNMNANTDSDRVVIESVDVKQPARPVAPIEEASIEEASIPEQENKGAVSLPDAAVTRPSRGRQPKNEVE